MRKQAFLPCPTLPHPPPSPLHTHLKCTAHRVAVPCISPSAAPRRSARVSILTDFSSNPMTAVADRVADPLSAVLMSFAAIFGALFASLFSSRTYPTENSKLLDPDDENRAIFSDDAGVRFPAPGNVGGSTPGEDALWLNMSLRTLWRLFRRSTNSLTRDVLQPVFDQMELPNFVHKVKIVGLTLGESPALVRKIQRLPSRSLSEIQYRFGARLIGDKEGQIDLIVKLGLPGFPAAVAVPVTVSQLDIDAKVWVGFTVVPYRPWIRLVQWALVKMPAVKVKVRIAKYLPVSAIPLLSNVLNKVLTNDLPREFLFPKTQLVDLVDKSDTDADVEKAMLEARGVDTSQGEVSNEVLRARFPDLCALFESLDVNGAGRLNSSNVSNGLIEWGYASEADRNSICNLLDVNNNGFVDLQEFVAVWDDLKNVFVPRQFRGLLTGVLLKAEGLRTPTLGGTDPYVELQVESQSTISKRNKATSRTGRTKGSAVWNQGWELFVRQPKTAILTVVVREGSSFSYYKDYIARMPIPKTHSGSGIVLSPVERANALDNVIGFGTVPVADLGSTAKTIWVELTRGGGRVRMDVQFSEFVDPKVP